MNYGHTRDVRMFEMSNVFSTLVYSGNKAASAEIHGSVVKLNIVTPTCRVFAMKILSTF